MPIPTNDLGRSLRRERAEIDAAIGRVLASGWLVHGQEHQSFEAEFARYVGAAECIGVANGTDALEIALRAVGVEPGDRVAMVANAGFYAATACLSIGAAPVFVDVDRQSLTMSPESLRRALKRDVRATVITHLYGGLARIDELALLCRQHGAAIVEDCAQATGARDTDGRMAGAFGDAGCFSFYPTKNLAAIGDGGAVVTSDATTAERCRRLRQYGWSERYVVGEAGWNSRLDEIQAAVLRGRLKTLDARNARRREIAGAYAMALAGGTAELMFRDESSHVGHLAVMRTPERDAFRANLKERGISTDIHYPVSDDNQLIWRTRSDYDVVDGGLPETHQAIGEILSLPCFPELTDLEVETVCEALLDWAAR